MLKHCRHSHPSVLLLWRDWKSAPLSWLDGFPMKGDDTRKARRGLVSDLPDGRPRYKATERETAGRVGS